MNFNNCFHEICHLWVMVNYLGFSHGRAYIAYDDGIEGMLSIEGYRTVYNSYEDLENSLAFVVAGIVGDNINGQFDDHEDVFYEFSHDFSYKQDYKLFKKLYKSACFYHSLNLSEEEWFEDKFDEIDGFLKSENLDAIYSASKELMENGEFFLQG